MRKSSRKLPISCQATNDPVINLEISILTSQYAEYEEIKPDITYILSGNQ